MDKCISDVNERGVVALRPYIRLFAPKMAMQHFSV